MHESVLSNGLHQHDEGQKHLVYVIVFNDLVALMGRSACKKYFLLKGAARESSVTSTPLVKLFRWLFKPE